MLGSADEAGPGDHDTGFGGATTGGGGVLSHSSLQTCFFVPRFIIVRIIISSLK
jgi:hypothetical protein